MANIGLQLFHYLFHVLDYRSESELMFLQQDGALAHYGLAVRDYLREDFPQRWFERRGGIEWESRPPDITPVDLFFGV